MMRYGELVLEVFGSHLGGKMHQGLDNFYLIICYIKLSLIHAGSLWAGQGKGLRKRLYFWRIIISRFYKMDYLDLEITYDQAGENVTKLTINRRNGARSGIFIIVVCQLLFMVL